MVRSGRSGWYYRVLTPGTLTAGDDVRLVERPLPDFPFTGLLEFLYTRGRTKRRSSASRERLRCRRICAARHGGNWPRSKATAGCNGRYFARPR
jgi:MOSC domain-containing protein YiiM